MGVLESSSKHLVGTIGRAYRRIGRFEFDQFQCHLRTQRQLTRNPREILSREKRLSSKYLTAGGAGDIYGSRWGVNIFRSLI